MTEYPGKPIKSKSTLDINHTKIFGFWQTRVIISGSVLNKHIRRMSLEECLSRVLYKSRKSCSTPLSILPKLLLSQLLWPLSPRRPELSTKKTFNSNFSPLGGNEAFTWKKGRERGDQNITQHKRTKPLAYANSLGGSQGHSLYWVKEPISKGYLAWIYL